MNEDRQRTIPILTGLALSVALLPGPLAFAQLVLPPDALQQFKTVVGNRIEAVTILAGDYSAAGGIYTFRGGSLADLSTSKLGGWAHLIFVGARAFRSAFFPTPSLL